MSEPINHVTDSSPEDVLPERVRQHLERAFEIEGELGRGGMATVWRARRRSDHSVVAIKVLRPVLADAIGSRRFLREIEIAAHTMSPYLVPLQESGESSGLPYYVMPLIEGESLRARMSREGPLALGEVVRIGREIALALAALHRDGIVHRDVKPENILLRNGRDVQVADYGIARAVTVSATEDITSTGIVVGTPAYMSPEQAGGDPVEARSDQYAWGCVVHEMLLGVPPFHGLTSTSIIARHRHDPPPPLRSVRPAVPESLEAVVHKAMAKHPVDRFTNMEEVLAALDAVDLKKLESLSAASRRKRQVQSVALTAIVLTGGVVAVRLALRPALDSDRYAFLPLRTADSSLRAETERVSGLIRDALEDIEPERWVNRDANPSRADQSPVDERRAESIARRARARYYVTGSVASQPGHSDSVQVSVALRDLVEADDTTIVMTGARAALNEVALGAAVGLLPRLTGLEEQVNPASLIGRSPVVISNWLRGEREYRSSQFRSAYTFLSRAVAADSSLAPAAIRGAMAAAWLNDERSALQLVSLAQQHRSMLTTRQAAFAEALRLYVTGAADSAVMAIRTALAVDSTWAEPWVLAGEIFFHLQPRVPLDSQLLRAVPAPRTWPLERWARDAFLKASAVDAGLTPPLTHLAQMAARRGDVTTVQSLQSRLTRAGADSGWLHGLVLTHRCLSTPMSNADWIAAARTEARSTYFVATILTNASAANARSCAWRAWSALAQSDSATTNEKWTAVMGRFSMTAAEGDHQKALAIVDSAVANGISSALALYFLGAAAGIDPGSRVDDFVKQLDAAIDSRPATSLWLLSLWSARTSDTVRLNRVRARASVLLAQSGNASDTLVADVAQAYDFLARQDTTRALDAFSRLVSRAAPTTLQWSLWESLAVERLTYARLLLARGSAAQAHLVASVFDQPSVYLNPLFLRPSLELRAEAARILGDDALRRDAEDQLRRLTPGSR